MKKLKDKLLNGEKVYGTQIMMCDAAIGDILSSAGYDFLWLDTEHSCIDYKQLLEYIGLCEAKCVPTIIRLHIDDYNHTKRVLEMVPSGIIFPMINTREQAEKAIRSTYYPLKGTRGIGALRYGRYGLDSLGTLITKQEDMIRCIQLETKEAISNLKEIVKVEGIDCFVFGLWDLNFDIGKPGDGLCEEELKLVKRAIEILRENNKVIGMATSNTDLAFLQKWANMGISFIAAGSDFDFLRMGAVNTLKILKEIK